ncbi:MAG: RNA polymerase sigma-70 factor [Tannerella sp.]|jgi:RNA polymerase sigma-70 factor (ECF subfamily)|nr:RNA polymerase sigma-70 factor [Tannerella sp.]
MKNINQLLYRIINNEDEMAFKELYYIYYDRLFKFAMHILRNEMESEEVVSDVFFNVWQNKKQLLSIEDMDAWLYKAVKNKSLHYIEKNERQLRQEDLSFAVDYLSDNETPESRMMDDELRLALTEAVESLPEKCRIIFKLAFEDGLKHKQISEILSLSVRTIDAQIVIAKTKIKAAIRKYYPS